MLLNAYKTYTRPLRFCLFSLILFLYSYKKAGNSYLIIPRNPCEMPSKSPETFLFSIYSFLLCVNKEKRRGRTDTQGYVGRGVGLPFFLSFIHVMRE